MSSEDDLSSNSTSVEFEPENVPRSQPINIVVKRVSENDFRLSKSLPAGTSDDLSSSPLQRTISMSPTPDSIRERHKSMLLRDPSKSEPAKSSTSRRRTVSDAAQWLRQERQQKLHRELLRASHTDGTAHKFSDLVSLSRPTFCGVCNKVLWVLHRSAVICSDCGFVAHRSCAQEAHSCLGRNGSIASESTLGVGPVLPTTLGRRNVRIVVESAENLARRNMLRLPDPFAIIAVDEQTFRTKVVRKTLSPSWMDGCQMTAAPSSIIHIDVFDSKRYREGEQVGFLGSAIVPAAAFMDQSSLGEGATKIISFRLRKRHIEDVVTGTITLKVTVSPKSLNSNGNLENSSDDLISTSQGEGWQQPMHKLLKVAPPDQLLPPTPGPPRVRKSRSDGAAINVYWGEHGNNADCEDGIVSTLAVFIDDDPHLQDVYTGPRQKYKAVGFKPGARLRFVVKLTNYFGCSELSEPSEEIIAPEPKQSDDGKQHCPMFMAGFCYRGASCPLYHGESHSDADVSATLAIAAFAEDPDIQLAMALQASLASTQSQKIDSNRLPQYARDFHRREAKFRAKLRQESGDCRLSVSRGDLFKTSFVEVIKTPSKHLKRRLIVTFNGEGGLDYGGLAREWFYLLSLEIFDPELGMFSYCSDNDYALVINPDSAADEDHLLYFHFVGRIIGMAIFHHHFLDVSFAPSFYKQLLKKPVALSDLQEVDPEMHRSLLWILQNDVSEIPDMYFTVDYFHLGETRTHELKPGGADIEISEENKHEFVHLMLAWRLLRGIQQMSALMQGFFEVIPESLIASFNEKQLELLISGLRDYDLEDWKANTDYHGYIEGDDQVNWFWEILEDFSIEEKADFLQFCTGSSRVPVTGFQALQGSDGPRKFNIAKVMDLTRLPAAHTCFNRLDLPYFPTKRMMKERLMLAMHNAQGFGGD